MMRICGVDGNGKVYVKSVIKRVISYKDIVLSIVKYFDYTYALSLYVCACVNEWRRWMVKQLKIAIVRNCRHSSRETKKLKLNIIRTHASVRKKNVLMCVSHIHCIDSACASLVTIDKFLHTTFSSFCSTFCSPLSPLLFIFHVCDFRYNYFA